jgi:hypothetical protein
MQRSMPASRMKVGPLRAGHSLRTQLTLKITRVMSPLEDATRAEAGQHSKPGRHGGTQTAPCATR